MQPPTWNPRCLEMKLNSPETRNAERRRPQEVKPWVSNQNPSQIRPKIKSSACNWSEIWPKTLREAGMWRGGKLWRRKWEKWSVLNSQPWRTGRPVPQPVNRLVNGQRYGQRSNFPIFLAFSCLVILLLPFSVEIPNFFMSNAMGILIFGKKLTYFLRDCYMMHMRWNLCNHNAFPTRIHYTNIRSKRNNP